MATKIELSARRRYATTTTSGMKCIIPRIKKRNIIYVCNKSVSVTEMSRRSSQMPRDREQMSVKTNEHPVRPCCVIAGGARSVALWGLPNLRGRGHADYRRSELYGSFAPVALCEMTERGKIRIIKTKKNVIISLIVSKQQRGFAAKSSRPAWWIWNYASKHCSASVSARPTFLNITCLSC